MVRTISARCWHLRGREIFSRAAIRSRGGKMGPAERFASWSRESRPEPLARVRTSGALASALEPSGAYVDRAGRRSPAAKPATSSEQVRWARRVHVSHLQRVFYNGRAPARPRRDAEARYLCLIALHGNGKLPASSRTDTLLTCESGRPFAHFHRICLSLLDREGSMMQ